MYKFIQIKNKTVLKTLTFKVELKPYKNHVHFIFKRSIFGKVTKRQGLTSIKSDLTKFEYKVVALYMFQQTKQNCLNNSYYTSLNYAKIFGSLFE